MSCSIGYYKNEVNEGIIIFRQIEIAINAIDYAMNAMAQVAIAQIAIMDMFWKKINACIFVLLDFIKKM